jgi:hypothetical protein
MKAKKHLLKKQKSKGLGQLSNTEFERFSKRFIDKLFKTKKSK